MSMPNKPIDLRKEFDRLNAKLNLLLQDRPEKKETWVKAVVVQKLTGWDREGLRMARENKLFEMRKVGNIYEYLLESLHPLFIRDHGK